MKKILYLVSAIAIAFTSCSSDDNTDSSSILPQNINFTASDGISHSQKLTYDGRKLAGIEQGGYKTKYTYTGDYVSKVEEFDLMDQVKTSTEYVYTNGKLTSIISKETSSSSYAKTTFIHKADGSVSYEKSRVGETGSEDDKKIGKLTFENGNLLKNEYTYNNSEYLINYKYDTKNNPNKNILGFDLLLDAENNINSRNNVTSITTTGSEERITSYTYTYDANDYPKQEVLTFPGGEIVTTQYFY